LHSEQSSRTQKSGVVYLRQRMFGYSDGDWEMENFSST
jgi:hypothetical protein